MGAAAGAPPVSTTMAYLLWLPPLGLFGAHHHYLGTATATVRTATLNYFTLGWMADAVMMPSMVSSANAGAGRQRPPPARADGVAAPPRDASLWGGDGRRAAGPSGAALQSGAAGARKAGAAPSAALSSASGSAARGSSEATDPDACEVREIEHENPLGVAAAASRARAAAAPVAARRGRGRGRRAGGSLRTATGLAGPSSASSSSGRPPTGPPPAGKDGRPAQAASAPGPASSTSSSSAQAAGAGAPDTGSAAARACGRPRVRLGSAHAGGRAGHSALHRQSAPFIVCRLSWRAVHRRQFRGRPGLALWRSRRRRRRGACCRFERRRRGQGLSWRARALPPRLDRFARVCFVG